MKIYLMRHGIPIERLATGMRHDSQRPLTDEGKEQAAMVAKALRKLGAKPQKIFASPLARAVQTAEIFADVLGGELEPTGVLAPGGGPEDVIHFLEKHADLEEVMLVGHEPDMGEIVSELVGGGKLFSLPFKKTGVCRVDVSEMPPALSGTLKWLITPKLIESLS